jgi:hypothetical protein
MVMHPPLLMPPAILLCKNVYTEDSQVLIADDLKTWPALAAQAVSDSRRQDFLLLQGNNPDFFPPLQSSYYFWWVFDQPSCKKVLHLKRRCDITIPDRKAIP